jgi:hypothetical protein
VYHVLDTIGEEHYPSKPPSPANVVRVQISWNGSEETCGAAYTLLCKAYSAFRSLPSSICANSLAITSDGLESRNTERRVVCILQGKYLV